MEDLGSGIAGAALFIGIFGLIGLGAWLKFRGEMAQKQMMFDAQKAILDKLGSGAEVTEFLGSPEGKEFFERLKTPARPERPKPNYLDLAGSLMLFGVITTAVGLGLFAGAAMFDGRLAIPGAICFFVGIALFSAPWINYRLFRRWGWINDETSGASEAKLS